LKPRGSRRPLACHRIEACERCPFGSPSPRFIAVFALIALLLAPLLWVYDIDRVEILAFTGDGVEALREIIKDQIDQPKKPSRPRTAAPQCSGYASSQANWSPKNQDWGDEQCNTQVRKLLLLPLGGLTFPHWNRQTRSIGPWARPPADVQIHSATEFD